MRISSPSPSPGGGKKKHPWLINNTIVDRYIKEAKLLLTTQEQNHIAAALKLVDAALSHSPRRESALELKARSLLFLRRFNDVAAMLQDYIPSLKMAAGDDIQDSPLIDNSSTQLLREKTKQVSAGDGKTYFKCFSLTGFIKKKVITGLWKWKKSEKEGQWRYLVLGQACFHLGLVEDAMILLQTAKRLATAAFRRQSICWSEDSFSFRELPLCRDFQSTLTATTTTTTTATTNRKLPVTPKSENESISQLLSHVKFLLRRKTAAIAALNAGLYLEAIRHFSKILDSRRATPQGFLAQCYMYRALAYWSAGRLADSIADCNKTLALDSSCIEALNSRARIFEEIGCITDSLHDLEHLKLLYNAILRDKRQQGPAWRRQSVEYREIPGKLCSLATKIENLKKIVASGEKQKVDYYALIGLRWGCSRSELERAFLLLTLRHKPEKSLSFIERCEFGDSCDSELVRDSAKSSASMLYKMIQKGHTSVMNTIILDENAEEKQRKNAIMQVQQQAKVSDLNSTAPTAKEASHCKAKVENKATESMVIQGMCCRDIGVVENSLSQDRFNRPIAVKYEALSC